MTHRKRILISGYYGFSNAGDEAVLSMIVSGLREESGGSLDISVLSASPAETASTYGVGAVPRMSLKHVMTALGECDLLISGGGSLLQDATSLKSLMYYLTIIRMAQIKQKKVMILGQGIGPLKRWISRRTTADVLNGVDCITVRDRQSAELLIEIGVKKPEITVTADPTLLLKPSPADEVDALLTEAGLAPDTDIIAVSLRGWDAAPRLIDEMVVALEKLSLRISARMLFINMHIPGDERVSERARENIWSAAVQPRIWTAPQLVGVLGRCRLVMGMRLHALILAAAAGTPSIGIAYDPKVEQFCLSAGQDCISLADVIDGHLLEKVTGVWESQENSALSIKEKLPAMREAAKQNIIKALEVLR
ncbi:MAG: polysaccharide pyruvyl transferase CsaB [Armatimonadota bacterium]